jgi:hypothetical protein
MSEVLQFERAEYEQPAGAVTCAQCSRTLTQSYYQVNGHVVCDGCARKLRAEGEGGSRAGRVVRAIGAGLLAAVLGALLYYGVAALTGYEFGLIAIVVGFGVGSAVRWGSNGRGGWAYQTLAIGLTYLAIVATYAPAVVQGLRELEPEQAASGPATAGAQPVSQTADAPADAAADAAPPTAGSLILALAVLALIVCAAPFLAGLQNIIGLIIIGIGLYEAWKLNKRTPFEITGPHPVAVAPTAVA